MDFIYLILIAMANNIDNIGVGISYSIRGAKISTLKNLWIAIITFSISFLSGFFGKVISGFLNQHVSSIISMLLLVSIGILTITGLYFNKEVTFQYGTDTIGKNNFFNIVNKSEKVNINNYKNIDYKEATLLGIALSINNIGGCLSSGMLGLNSFLIAFFSALISFLVLWIGNYITAFFNKFNLGNKAIIAAGVMLIVIGLKQVI